jgi:hypothetical protein
MMVVEMEHLLFAFFRSMERPDIVQCCDRSKRMTQKKEEIEFSERRDFQPCTISFALPPPIIN